MYHCLLFSNKICEHNSLRQCTFIVVWLLWIRNGLRWVLCFMASHKACIRICRLIWRFARGKIHFHAPSELLVALNSPHVVRVRSSYSHWLLTRDRFSSLPYWYLHSSSPERKQRSNKKNLLAIWSHNFNLIMEMASHQHCLLLVRGKLFMWREIYKAISNRCGDHWGLPWWFPTTSHIEISICYTNQVLFESFARLTEILYPNIKCLWRI